MNIYELAMIPKDDFEDLVVLTGSRMGIKDALVEKDFWVTFVLKYLFEDSPWKHSLLFKGGTSLSKCYNAIQRFSEDIDLLLDWRLLGYSISGPTRGESRKQQEKINDELISRTEIFLKNELVPKMQSGLSLVTHDAISIHLDGLDVWVSYPSVFGSDYVSNKVLLEIGPRGIWGRAEDKEVSSYISQIFPTMVSDLAKVKVISLERTFCEKLLILHANSMRGKLGTRHSRHYYDVVRLADLIDIGPIRSMIREVAEFKSLFYPGAGYGYDMAMEGILRIVPPDVLIPDLEKDYHAMREMLFGNLPDIKELLERLERLQAELDRYQE